MLFRKPRLISSHNHELDQYSSFDKLASHHFNKIGLEYECDLDPQFCDSVPNFEFMLTHVSLPDLDYIVELTLIPVP